MIENQEFTYIGKSSLIKGNFEFKGTTHLQGTLEGEIKTTNAAKLILEIGSMTRANIESYDIDIYGHFVGEIKSEGRVTIFPTAEVSGLIIAKAIEILPGAIVNFNGHTNESIK